MKIILIFIFILISTPINFLLTEEFLTLRNSTANLRQGPSFDYPVKIFYKKNIYLF